MAVTLDAVTAAYVATREEIRAMEAEIETRKTLQAKREAWLLAELEKSGLQNAKTLHGCVYKALKESVVVVDKQVFFDWVFENDKREFLEGRVAKTAATEMMGPLVKTGAGECREGQPPPGCNYSATRTVQVRKT